MNHMYLEQRVIELTAHAGCTNKVFYEQIMQWGMYIRLVIKWICDKSNYLCWEVLNGTEHIA